MPTQTVLDADISRGNNDTVAAKPVIPPQAPSPAIIPPVPMKPAPPLPALVVMRESANTTPALAIGAIYGEFIRERVSAIPGAKRSAPVPETSADSRAYARI